MADNQKLHNILTCPDIKGCLTSFNSAKDSTIFGAKIAQFLALKIVHKTIKICVHFCYKMSDYILVIHRLIGKPSEIGLSVTFLIHR